MPASTDDVARIQVCCRICPVIQIALGAEDSTVSFEAGRPPQQAVTDLEKNLSYSFDQVFGTDATQQTVFSQVGKRAVQEALLGYHGTIIAYGQTGSGKTHTISGSDSCNDGLLPLSIDFLFSEIENALYSIEFTLKFSYLEIYQENLRDLLQPDNKSLSIQSAVASEEIQDDAIGGIKGLTWSYVSSRKEISSLLRVGNINRTRNATKMNKNSSRSHTIAILCISQLNRITRKTITSRFTFVDLAGSEKVSKTGASGQLLEEAKKINRSLSCLGNVINALVDKDRKHVPYRESKLTRILSESLGGNSKTFLVVCISAFRFNYEESISSLRFGERAKNVHNRAIVNEQISEEETRHQLLLAKETIEKQSKIIKEFEVGSRDCAFNGMQQEMEKLKQENQKLEERERLYRNKTLELERQLEEVELSKQENQSYHELIQKQLHDAQLEIGQKNNQLEEIQKRTVDDRIELLKVGDKSDADFEKIHQTLLEDLQNRCERVVALQMQVSDLQRELESATYFADARKRIKELEKLVRDLLIQQSSLVATLAKQRSNNQQGKEEPFNDDISNSFSSFSAQLEKSLSNNQRIKSLVTKPRNIYRPVGLSRSGSYEAIRKSQIFNLSDED